MRRLAILFVPFFVAGCALPPAITLASFAADGISYVATGKSTTDHALSALAQEDCAMLRALQEEAICVPKSKVPVYVATTEPPAKRLPNRGRNEVEYQSSPTSVLAFMQTHKDFGVEPAPAPLLQLAEKTLPATPATMDTFQLAKKGAAAAPKLAGMPANIGRIVLSHCAGGGGMQPAAQCILGPDA